MSRWTDEELRELTTLWPTHSVLQIAKQCIARARRYAARQSGCALMGHRRTILPRMLMRAT